jgi:leucyl aminopeptidase
MNTIKYMNASKFRTSKTGVEVVYVIDNGDLGVHRKTQHSALLTSVIKSKLFEPKLGSTYTIAVNDKKNVCFVGLGKCNEKPSKNYMHENPMVSFVDLRTAFAHSIAATAKDNLVYFNLTTLPRCTHLGSEYMLQFKSVEALGFLLRASEYKYTMTLGKSKPKNNPRKRIRNVVCNEAVDLSLAAGVLRGDAINRAKYLGDLPSNICTPTYLSNIASEIAKQPKVTAKILGEKAMAKLGMGSFLSVTAGSTEPAVLITLEYRGATRGKGKLKSPIVLVGKGITFDTGGISLKPCGKMSDMKSDMGGAASVLSAFEALVKMGIKRDLVCIVGSAENCIGPDATKPNAVVTSMSGRTIEILNTDAEGRLVLCDCLTYAQTNYDASIIIDVATLTGAVVAALGAQYSGVFSNNDKLAKNLVGISEECCDRAWHLPCGKEFVKMCSSKFADISNLGKGCGASTAAAFLSEFIEDNNKTQWAHIDCAGTFFQNGKSVGRPVSLLINAVKSLAQ